MREPRLCEDTVNDGEAVPSLRAAGVADILAEKLRILQDSRLERPSRTGDVDCAVVNLDRFWPLRLQRGWRLCQRLHYDVRSWYCVLERDGEVLCVDLLDDPRGLGRDGFPSSLVFAEDGDSPTDDDVAAPAMRAAYLTVKRLRKQIRADGPWRIVASLARDDPEAYRRALTATLGRQTGEQLATSVLESDGAPPEWLRRRARRVQQWRRFGTPVRAVTVPTLQTARVLSRIARPTGIVVVVAGPDGVGKSTLAAALPPAAAGLFRRTMRYHSRPSVLPRPGAVLGRPAPDSTAPHARAPHGPVLSTALVMYHWFDFLAGYVVRVAHVRARTGLVIVERGWWDIAVDPLRYRISAPPWLIKALGRVLPHPDLTLILNADEDVIFDRKRELPRAELARQQRRWREVVPARDAPVYLDVARPEYEVLAMARSEIVASLERRALSRLDAGWVGLPPGVDPRWLIPRGPRRVARTGIGVYNPQTPRAQSGWELGRSLASVGGFRLLPRTSAPPRAVREALAPHVPPRCT